MFAAPGEAITCSITSPSGTLSFGTLDPGIGTDVIVTTTITVLCSGPGAPGNFDLSDDDGLNEAGVNGNRMINPACPGGPSFLAYALDYLTPQPVKKNQDVFVTITGTVLGAIYQNACFGSYSDQVTITVAP